MATSLKNLSDYDINSVPSAVDLKFGIVVSEWNIEITNALLKGACDTLLKHGAKEEDITIEYVPGSFELVYGAKVMSRDHNLDAIILLGCVIQGETRHFDFICQSVAYGTTLLNAEGYRPFIFGVLTTDNLQQAIDRSGGKHGNKGVEAAVTALKMIHKSPDLPF